MYRRILPWLGLLAMLPIAAGCSGSEPAPKVGVQVGDLAPELEGLDVNGKPVKLSDYRGKVVVVDFWATWCGPCRELVPFEKRIVQSHAGKPFVFLGVSADKTPSDLKRFLEDQEIHWANIYDGPEHPLTDAWGVFQFPTLFLIDANGVIRGKDFVNDRQLERSIDKVLSEMKTP
jgi:thiol-disulfide isomerase/thioredoxin